MPDITIPPQEPGPVERGDKPIRLYLAERLERITREEAFRDAVKIPLSRMLCKALGFPPQGKHGAVPYDGCLATRCAARQVGAKIIDEVQAKPLTIPPVPYADFAATEQVAKIVQRSVSERVSFEFRGLPTAFAVVRIGDITVKTHAASGCIAIIAALLRALHERDEALLRRAGAA